VIAAAISAPMMMPALLLDDDGLSMCPRLLEINV
jgi:hypothetical protein